MLDALSVEVLTDGPLRVGTRMRVPTRIGFLRTTDLMEVTAFEPPERWAVVHRGLVTGEGTFTLHESDGGERTRVDWDERLAAPLGRIGRVGMTLLRPSCDGSSPPTSTACADSARSELLCSRVCASSIRGLPCARRRLDRLMTAAY